MDLKEIGLVGLYWIYLAKDRGNWRVVVNTVMDLWVQYNAGNFLIT